MHSPMKPLIYLKGSPTMKRSNITEQYSKDAEGVTYEARKDGDDPAGPLDQQVRLTQNAPGEASRKAWPLWGQGAP